MTSRNIVLASSSKYRKNLLKKIIPEFLCDSPDIDESRLDGESAVALVQRLSLEKARAVANRIQTPNTLIIASDQVAVLGQHILGKPGSIERAVEQLSLCSGKTVTFYTGLCLLNTDNQRHQLDCVPFEVSFRTLNQDEIHAYVQREQPLDCAGSFKCEGLGIALFSQLKGEDPNSLIGLPLIKLCDMFRQEGINPLL